MLNKRIIRDIILITSLLLISGVFIIIWLTRNNDIGNTAVVSYRNEEINRFDLHQNNTYEIQGNISLMYIVVEDGFVYVKDSGCDNQICVNHEKINRVGDVIACVPNLITIEVVK